MSNKKKKALSLKLLFPPIEMKVTDMYDSEKIYEFIRKDIHFTPDDLSKLPDITYILAAVKVKDQYTQKNQIMGIYRVWKDSSWTEISPGVYEFKGKNITHSRQKADQRIRNKCLLAYVRYDENGVPHFYRK